MKTVIKVTKSKSNPAALITIKSGWKIIDDLIKPKQFYKDAMHTKGLWQIPVGKTDNKIAGDATQELLDNLVYQFEQEDKIEYVADNIELFNG